MELWKNYTFVEMGDLPILFESFSHPPEGEEQLYLHC